MISNIDDTASENGHYRARTIRGKKAHRTFNPRVLKQERIVFKNCTAQDLEVNPITGYYTLEDEKFEQIMAELKEQSISGISHNKKKKRKKRQQSKKSSSKNTSKNSDPPLSDKNTINRNSNRVSDKSRSRSKSRERSRSRSRSRDRSTHRNSKIRSKSKQRERERDRDRSGSPAEYTGDINIVASGNYVSQGQIASHINQDDQKNRQDDQQQQVLPDRDPRRQRQQFHPPGSIFRPGRILNRPPRSILNQPGVMQQVHQKRKERFQSQLSSGLDFHMSVSGSSKRNNSGSQAQQGPIPKDKNMNNKDNINNSSGQINIRQPVDQNNNNRNNLNNSQPIQHGGQQNYNKQTGSGSQNQQDDSNNQHKRNNNNNNRNSAGQSSSGRLGGSGGGSDDSGDDDEDKDKNKKDKSEPKKRKKKKGDESDSGDESKSEDSDFDISTVSQPKHIAQLNDQNRKLQEQVRKQKKQIAEMRRRAKQGDNDNSAPNDGIETDIYLKILEQQNEQMQNLMRCAISKRRK